MTLHSRADTDPLIVRADALPAELYLWSGQPERGHGPVYLEVCDAQGRTLIVEPERSHLEGVYIVHCIFDRYGSWYLTWHGLRERPSEPVVIEVWSPVLYEGAEVC